MFGGLVDKKFLSDVVVYDVGTIFVVVSHFYYRPSKCLSLHREREREREREGLGSSILNI